MVLMCGQNQIEEMMNEHAKTGGGVTFERKRIEGGR
jgi:hypothetical protein